MKRTLLRWPMQSATAALCCSGTQGSSGTVQHTLDPAPGAAATSQYPFPAAISTRRDSVAGLRLARMPRAMRNFASLRDERRTEGDGNNRGVAAGNPTQRKPFLMMAIIFGQE